MSSRAGLVWLELSCGWLCGCCYDRVSETAPKLIDKASMTAGAYSGLQGPQLRVLGKFGGDA